MATQILSKLFKTDDNLAFTILRIPVGLIFVAHGAQKLFGWFGGYGLEATGQWMASIGFAPGYLMALLAGSAEFFGGLALILGLAARPAAFVTAFTMLMAMKVHLGNGLFVANNGYEFALTLLVSSLAIALGGAGKFAMDSYVSKILQTKVGVIKPATA